MSAPSALWLYLHFPLLPLEMCYPQASPGPAVLLDERKARLWLCNHAAASEGLTPGMAVATACSICPSLTLLTRQAQQEPQQLESLALWAGSFSAQVALQAPTGLLLEIASMLHYFQGLKAFHRHLLEQLEPLSFSVRLATGHTPLAARLLAQASCDPFNDPFNDHFPDHSEVHANAPADIQAFPRSAEKAAARSHLNSPPNGQEGAGARRKVLSESVEAHLALLQQLPVSALDLDAKTRERLDGMGLSRLQQVLSLPRNDLAARLGPGLLDYLDRLVGRKPDPPRYFAPPPEFRRRLELGHEVENTQALLFPLRRLLAELEGYLALRQLRALQLQLQLQERETDGQRISLNHSDGEYRSNGWLELCRLRLERVALQQPVVALQLEVSRFRDQTSGNQDLFAREGALESPEQLLSRLQIRLGEAAVQRLGLVADHRPERSWQPLRPDQPYVSQPGRPGRPNWLLEQPAPLPRQQIEQQIGQRIQLLKGPERIATGWWDGHPVRRDYYTGRWPDGRLGWLFRDDRGNWYLHGWFG